jgi:hypothetical protein
MKCLLLVVVILTGFTACVASVQSPASPPQMTTVTLPEPPAAAFLKARRAVTAMGGHIVTDDATVRMAFAEVPGPVMLHVAVIPDPAGAEVLVTGHVMATHPGEDAWRELRAYTSLLRQ